MPQEPPLLWDDFNGIAMGSDHTVLILTKRLGIKILLDIWGHRIELAEGLRLRFFYEDPDPSGTPDALVAEGVVYFDHYTGRWMARIDNRNFRHRSEIPPDAPHWANSADWPAIRAACRELAERVPRGEFPTDS